MRRVRIAAAVTFGGLALIIAIKLIVPTINAAHADPGADDKITLNGVLYDFSSTHPDFDVMPATGLGHHAGNVQPRLDGARRPVFASGGYKVAEQWHDRLGRAIAPHVAGMRGGLLAGAPLGFRVEAGIDLAEGASVDAFDSNLGPYGAGGNLGRAALVSTNSTADRAVRIDGHALIRGDLLVGPRGEPRTIIESRGYVTGRRSTLDRQFDMPAPSLPDDLEPYRELIAIDSATTLTGDLTPGDGRREAAIHCGELRVTDEATLTVDGNLVIRCDRRLDLRRGQIQLRPGAMLTIYVSKVGGGSGDVRITDRAFVNTETSDAARVTIVAIGPGRLEVGRSHVYATIIAPERELHVRDGGHVYGAFVGGSIKLDRHCGLHADLGLATPTRSNHALSVRESVRVIDRSTIDSFDSGAEPREAPVEPARVGHARIGHAQVGHAQVGHALLEHAWVSTNAVSGRARVTLAGESTIRGNLSLGPAGIAEQIVANDAGSYVSGPIGRLAQAHAIPLAMAPDLGASGGDRQCVGGVHMINGDVRYRTLRLVDSAVLNILGDVTMRIDDTLAITEESRIQLDPGATLTVYVGHRLEVDGFSRLNANTGDPRLVSVRLTGPRSRMTLKNHAHAYAWVYGARADIEVADKSEFFGSFAGRNAVVRRQSSFHVDTAGLDQCLEIFDAAGVAGSSGDGGITGAESFDQWYRAVNVTNKRTGHEIRLTRDDDGVYSYIDDAFYPLDDALGGNEGERHNNHFTGAYWARFRYEACERQFVTFEGGDGAWLFIDGRLVLDLGGVRSRRLQRVDLDRLGLEPGRTYSFRLFTAQRRAGDSIFRLRTNVQLMSDHTAPELAAQFD